MLFADYFAYFCPRSFFLDIVKAIQVWNELPFEKVQEISVEKNHTLEGGALLSSGQVMIAMGKHLDDSLRHYWVPFARVYHPTLNHKKIRQLDTQGDRVRLISLTRDGRRLAVVHQMTELGDSIKIWDLELFQLVRTLVGYRSTITVMAFSPNGNEIISAAKDGTLAFWNETTGENLLSLEGSVEPRAMAFSNSGTKITFWHKEGISVFQKKLPSELRATFKKVKVSKKNKASSKMRCSVQ